MKTLAFFFALMLPLFARIGETVEQCDSRYGSPIIDNAPESRTYRKAGFDVLVVFHDGKAVILRVSKAERDVLDKPIAMSDAEIETILESNSGGSKWKKSNFAGFMKKSWESEDDSLMASYDPFGRAMMIITKEHLIRDMKETEDKEKKNLDGF